MIKEYDREAITPWGDFGDFMTRRCYDTVGIKFLFSQIVSIVQFSCHKWWAMICCSGIIFTESKHSFAILAQESVSCADMLLHGSAAVHSTQGNLLRNTHAQYRDRVRFGRILFVLHCSCAANLSDCRLFDLSKQLKKVTWSHQVLVWIANL